MTSLERQSVQDHEALLAAIAELRASHAQTAAELAALRRLLQLTYRGLVDAEPLDVAALDREAIAAHVCAAVAKAPRREDPFPHLVVPHLLPDPFYELLLRAIPAPTFWRDAGYMRENWNVEEDVASEFSVSTWQFMHREIAARVLMPRLLDRFADTIAAYWRDVFGLVPTEQPESYVCDEGRLLLRRPGYKLEPHLDPPTAILTVLVYLARPGDPDMYGTDLYTASPLPARRTGIMYPGRHGIDIALRTTVPFQAGTAIAFVTPLSVHGAELPADSDATFERVSYQFLASLDDAARRRRDAATRVHSHSVVQR